jgi:hypothetical protein
VARERFGKRVAQFEIGKVERDPVAPSRHPICLQQPRLAGKLVL